MSPDVVVVAPSVAEGAPPPPPAVVTVDGETIVAVAEIEASRDVAIAEQHTEQTQIMADAVSAEEQEDIRWLKEILADLQRQCETHAGELSNQRTAMLAMQEQMQQMAEQMAALIAVASTPEPPPSPSTPEPDLTPPPSGEGQGDPANPAEPNPPAPPAKRQRKWL